MPWQWTNILSAKKRGFSWNSDIRIKQETVGPKKILRLLVKIFLLGVPQHIWHRSDLG